MPRIVVAGGGFVGLSMAMMLAKQGHDVTVLERDGGATPRSPDQAWQAWAGTASHSSASPTTCTQPGATSWTRRCRRSPKRSSVRAPLCSTCSHSCPRSSKTASRGEGDERFVTITGRRPVIEYAVATAAQDLDVRRGVFATELMTGPQAAKGVPNVTGVRTSNGEELAAGLVIDAMGRRSGLPGWLADLGALSVPTTPTTAPRSVPPIPARPSSVVASIRAFSRFGEK